MTARAQHPFSNFNSAEPAADSADTVAVSNDVPHRDAAAGYALAQSFQNFNSAESPSAADTAVASCPAQIPDAAVGSNSIQESAGQLGCPRVTAGDTDALRILGVSSPADFSRFQLAGDRP